MNFIKTAFLLSLFNFMVVGSIVLAFKKPEVIVLPVINEVSPTPIVKMVKNVTSETRPTVIVDAPVLPTKGPVVDNRCIIVVDSIQYDITRFRSLHSGGDIFQCGTDMSNIFHGQHDNSFVGKMSQYRI